MTKLWRRTALAATAAASVLTAAAAGAQVATATINACWPGLARFDADSDAILNAKEIRAAGTGVFSALDRDRDDVVSREEYVACVPTLDRSLSDARVVAFDTNRDSRWTLEEFSAGWIPDDFAIVRVVDIKGPMQVGKGPENRPQPGRVELRDTGNAVVELDWERGRVIDLARIRADEVVGSDVYNLESREVGEVEDIVVGTSDNALYAIVEVGGFLGVGEREVAVPFDRLRIVGERVILMSHRNEAELKALPAYDQRLFTRYRR